MNITLFIVISLLEQIGFEARNSIREQIQEHFYVDGLQDGTTVVLERDDIKVHVAFNDLMKTHPLIALSKGSNFCGEDTKKPDIRLDCYVKEDGKYVYKSSIM